MATESSNLWTSPRSHSSFLASKDIDADLWQTADSFLAMFSRRACLCQVVPELIEVPHHSAGFSPDALPLLSGVVQKAVESRPSNRMNLDLEQRIYVEV